MDKRELTLKIENSFNDVKAIVIGDIMVDEYITGRVRRISPEAPVPVLDFKERSLQAGGASNVAHNMQSLGATVSVVGTAAMDANGVWLRKHFEELRIGIDGIFAEGTRPTTTKARYATKGQQLLRVDNEDARGISEETQRKILDYLEKNIKDCSVVVLSDYCKGVFEDGEFVKAIIRLCGDNGVLVGIDSKSKDIGAFKGADFVKPNNLELEAAVNIRIEDEASLDMAGRKYLELSGAKALIVTRGSKGISLFVPGQNRADFPAKDVQVYDVCGAGDTVISTVGMGMACDLEIADAIRLANLAAGVVISRVGTVAVERDELLRSVNEG